MSDSKTRKAGTIISYMRLMRFPAVFTACSDICLGYVISGNTEFTVPFGFLLLGSAAIYLAGMVFNDYFDRQEDAVERPNRPIPSGAISAQSAKKLGTTLLAIGVAAAMTVGLQSAVVGLVLVIFVLAYDAGGKKTVAGPLLMGGCRGLNILLGASLTSIAELNVTLIATIACCISGYIAAVTLFAKHEAGESSQKSPLVEFFVLLIPLLVLILFISSQASYEEKGLIALCLASGIIVHRAFRAVVIPQAKTVQLAVKTMLLSLVTLEAAIVYALVPGALPWVIGMLLLYIPMLYLVRLIAIT